MSTPTTASERLRWACCLGMVAIFGTSLAVLSWQPAVDTKTAPLVRGRVVGEAGPLAGATVRIKGTDHVTQSGADGRFELRPSHADGTLRVTASHVGHYIGGADIACGADVTISLVKHPVEDARDYEWVSPDAEPEHPRQCGNCHEQIANEWSGSAHSRSASNPFFRHVYDGTDAAGRENVGWNLLAEYPDGAGVCYSCHVPSLEPTLENVADLRRASGVHAEGVHCDFCHKVAEVQPEPIGLKHGRFAMTLIRPADRGQNVLLGPLDDADRGDLAPPENVHSPLYRESRYCASCHEGVLFGTHAYSTYSEWLESPQAASGIQCQQCHMKPTGKLTNLAPGRGGIERDPLTLASHSLPGSDPEFLREHLRLELKLARVEQGIAATVSVTPLGIGHRMPTGHPSRQLLLCVEAFDRQAKPLALLSGPILPDLAGDGDRQSGALAGLAGRLYAKVLEDFDGQQPVPYWRPNRLAYDSRLNPDETDTQKFVFPASPDVKVRARLIYRRFSYAEAQQKGWTDTETLVHEEWASLPSREIE
jgi:hypothetical protein